MRGDEITADTPDQNYSGDVLVVDDDWIIRETIRIAMEREGFRVADASGVDEARKLWEGPDRPFDLAVLDVELAGEENGIMLAEEMDRRGAARRFLFVSGSYDVAGEELPVPADRSTFLRKPFGMIRLAEEVRALLADVG